jgi:hypothetical protein
LPDHVCALFVVRTKFATELSTAPPANSTVPDPSAAALPNTSVPPSIRTPPANALPFAAESSSRPKPAFTNFPPAAELTPPENVAVEFGCDTVSTRVELPKSTTPLNAISFVADTPPNDTSPRISTGCGTVRTAVPERTTPPFNVNGAPAVNVNPDPAAVAFADNVNCVPESTDKIRVPAGMFVPVTTIPTTALAVLETVTTGEPKLVAPAVNEAEFGPNALALSATKVPAFNVIPPLNVFAPLNTNAPLPSLINPAGAAAPPNVFRTTPLNTNPTGAVPPTVTVRVAPANSQILDTVGTDPALLFVETIASVVPLICNTPAAGPTVGPVVPPVPLKTNRANAFPAVGNVIAPVPSNVTTAVSFTCPPFWFNDKSSVPPVTNTSPAICVTPTAPSGRNVPACTTVNPVYPIVNDDITVGAVTVNPAAPEAVTPVPLLIVICVPFGIAVISRVPTTPGIPETFIPTNIPCELPTVIVALPLVVVPVRFAVNVARFRIGPNANEACVDAFTAVNALESVTVVPVTELTTVPIGTPYPYTLIPGKIPAASDAETVTVVAPLAIATGAVFTPSAVVKNAKLLRIGPATALDNVT